MALKDTWEDLKDAVAGEPNSGSEVTVEPINDIAHAVIDLEENKVDKVEGKGLSSNDYTDDDKNKLSELPYGGIIDAMREDITAIQSGKVDKPNITNSTETTVSTELADNTELIYGEVTSISVTFPASVGLDYISSIIFTTPAIITENYSTFPSDVYFKGDECDGGIFIPNAATRYTMLFYYDGTKIVGLVSGIEVTA